jgi:hypothetical protein
MEKGWELLELPRLLLMYAEAMDYLRRHPSEAAPVPAYAA